MQKYIRLGLIVTSIMVLNTRSMSEKADSLAESDRYNLNNLLEFYGIKNNFIKNKNYVTGFVQNIVASALTINDKNYDKRLLPYIKISKNNKYYIDYISYSTVITNEESIQCSFDVDSEVSIGVFDSNSSRRIEFTGVGEIIEGAGWISNYKVWVAKRNIDEKILKLKIIDMQKKTFIEHSIKLNKNANKSLLYLQLSKICKVE